MDCPACGHANREGAQFCGECGASLHEHVSCPQCGVVNPAKQKFCNACGQPLQETARPPTARDPRSYTPKHLVEKIRHARHELDAEPRTVTILFVDTVSSVATTESLELEEFHRAAQEQAQLMTDAVHRYEGTVLQFLGDGLMAAFGAPIAHEDSARRATAAALDMRDSLIAHAEKQRAAGSPAFRYRIGLNTGRVIVGGIGDDLSMEYTAVGDTVNLAARMEQLAQPDMIYVTEQTRRQAVGYFEFRDLGGLSVKGKSEPVQAYEVLRDLGTRTRFELALERGLTPLVGRQAELATLLTYFDEARKDAGQVVSIVGEAGIGKSRLLMEFRKSLEQEPHAWLQGQCITYGRTIAYTPVIGVLKDGFGIEEGDNSGQIIEKVTQATQDWEPAARETVPYLRFLLAVDPGDERLAQMDALVRRAGIFEALRASVEQMSRPAPLVIAIEDLHWIDEPSEEAVQSLVDAVAALPVLLVLTYRPGYTTRIAERGRVGLGTLTGEGAVAVARGALDCPELSDELCAQITAKAGGNPFYIEEVARHLVEAGVLERTNGSYRLTRPLAAEDIPGTIQDVIRARMDRLETEARETLQLAAVIGREFTERLLTRITDLREQVSHELQTLQQVELILRTSYFPEVAYVFKHALTCDVAYESLLAQRRRALHRLIGAAIEELYAERLPEHYGTLAHHWYEGREWRKALHYLQQVAAQAAERYANQEALSYYDRALEVCSHVGDVSNETRRAIYARKAEVCQITSDWPGAIANWSQVRDLARDAGDQKAEVLALADMGFAQMYNHQFDAAEATVGQALALADQLQDDAIRASALVVLGEIRQTRGDTRRALSLATEALRLSEATEQPACESRSRLYVSLNLGWRGHYDEALSTLAGGEATDEQALVTYDRMNWEFLRGLFLGHYGRYSEAISTLRECIRQCQRIGDTVIQSKLWNTLGWIHGELYDWGHGVEYNETALQLAEPLGDEETTSNARINLGDCAFGMGDLVQARQILETFYKELPNFHEFMKWRYSQHGFHSLGEVLLALGEPERALALADECLQLAERTDAPKNIVKARRLCGQVFAGGGKLAEAETEYRAALDIARPLGNPPQLWKTLDALGQVLLELGREQEALAAFEEALSIIEKVAADLDDSDLKTTFLSAPDVEAIRRRAR